MQQKCLTVVSVSNALANTNKMLLPPLYMVGSKTLKKNSPHISHDTNTNSTHTDIQSGCLTNNYDECI